MVDRLNSQLTEPNPPVSPPSLASHKGPHSHQHSTSSTMPTSWNSPTPATQSTSRSASLNCNLSLFSNFLSHIPDKIMPGQMPSCCQSSNPVCQNFLLCF